MHARACARAGRAGEKSGPDQFGCRWLLSTASDLGPASVILFLQAVDVQD